MAFGNRVEGSFIRLSQGKEAPRVVTWGEYDRDALIRLPAVVQTGERRAVSPPTIEFRLPDGSAHPHYLLAGVAQAAVHGEELEDVSGILERTAARRARVHPGEIAPVPRSVPQVTRELTKHREAFEAGGVFPAVLLAAALRPRRI
jgi:glutamine synthetase